MAGVDNFDTPSSATLAWGPGLLGIAVISNRGCDW